MEASSEEITKGLDTKTVRVLKDRLGKAYKSSSNEDGKGFACYFHSELKIGWILYEGKILIYNNENVYFDMKLPSKLHYINAGQVNVVNTEQGTYMVIVEKDTVYQRLINEELDLRFTSAQIETLDRDEIVSVTHFMKSHNEVPTLVLATSKGRLITAQIFIDEDVLKLDEILIEEPKRLVSSLTSFFTGGGDEETNFHQIYSDVSDKNNAILYVIGERRINIWKLSTNGADLWKINVLNIFHKNVQIQGEIHTFKIVGQEIVNGEEGDEPIINCCVQIVYRGNKSNGFLVSYHLIRLVLDIDAKKCTEFISPSPLTEEKSYNAKDDDVKCLVCSNTGTVTYIFICYEDYT
jgi:hypothetical protein